MRQAQHGVAGQWPRTRSFPPHAAEMRRRPTVGGCEVYRHGEIELRPGGRLSTSAFVGNRDARFEPAPPDGSAFTAVLPPVGRGKKQQLISGSLLSLMKRQAGDQTRWRICCILIQLSLVQVCDFFLQLKKIKTQGTCLFLQPLISDNVRLTGCEDYFSPGT